MNTGPFIRTEFMLLLATVLLVGCKGRESKQQAPTTQPVAKAAAGVGQWGFRYDPMKWVESDTSLQGALVRTRVFKEPKPGDEKLIEAEIQKVLSEQRPEGGFTNDKGGDVVGATGRKLLRLYELGCDPARPEVKRAIAALRRAAVELEGDDAKKIGCYALRGMCQAGITQPPAVRASLLQTAGDIDNMLGRGCPWTPEVQLNALWAGREVADVAGALTKGVTWVGANLEPPGCSAGLGLCMPWSIVQMVCVIDDPACRDIAIKLVPMLLRLQKPNGGWGDDEGSASIWAFTALKKHGLLESLRELPPLPPDWRVVRSIPSPVKHKWSVMASDGERLWVHEPGSDRALALSPANGTVLKTVKLPERAGVFGVWGGSLWYLSGKSLCRVDPDTGKVVQRISLGFDFKPFVAMIGVRKTVLIPDQFEGGAWAFDPAEPAKAEMVRLAAGMPDYIASFGSDIWAVDSWAGAVIRTNLKGELLDWGEQPFGWAGIAWDGQRLWAFDHKNKRICIIEKSKATKWERPAPLTGFVRTWLMAGPFPSPAFSEKELAAIVAKRKDEPHVELIRAGHTIDYLKPVGGEAAARPKEGQTVRHPDGSTVRWAPYEAPAEAIWLHEVFGNVGRGPMVAYAYTTIDRPQAGKAYLALGSDDSAKVYLNGQLVHDIHVARPLQADADLVPVTFRKGTNELLIKVENALGTGGFILRPLDSLPVRGPALFPGKRSSWFGFERYDFKVDGRSCTVVAPREVAAGKPWIWRARFFGHEPQTDVALLREGFHLVYMDVAGMWGSDKAVAHWDAFYEYLTTKHAFAKKAALEGMSRGGLIIYNWGARNPDKVTCIYGDAPCCNFKMTRGFEEGEPHVDNEYLIKTILGPLAKANVPLIHVCGDADESVPVDEHTRVVEKRYKKLGGTIKVIIKPGVGHHPHSLKDPTPIVDFILKATPTN